MKLRQWKGALVGLLAGLLTCLLTTKGFAADLEVKVENLETDRGQVIIKLVSQHIYESEADLDALAKVTIKAQAPSVSHVFTGLPPGDYAVKVVQDLNANNDLDYNVFTGPAEPVGLSRVSWVDLHNLPDWQQIKFTLTERKNINVNSRMTVTLN